MKNETKIQSKMYMVTLFDKNNAGHMVMVIASSQTAALKMYDPAAKPQDWSCTMQSVMNNYIPGIIAVFNS